MKVRKSFRLGLKTLKKFGQKDFTMSTKQDLFWSCLKTGVK